MVTVFSGNVQGLRRNLTRHTFFNFLKEKNCDIACIQESYITEPLITEWNKNWGREIFANFGTPHSKGEIILFAKSFNATNVEVCHKESNILGVKFLHDGEQYVCINGYAPSRSAEKIEFYNKLQNLVRLYDDSVNVILCSDMNCTLNSTLDNLGGQNHNVAEINGFKNFVNNTGLLDTWRLFNMNNKEYTWKHKHRAILRRIDYVFMNDCTFNKVSNINIINIPNSDHRGYLCCLDDAKMPKGPSYWKFNNSLLNDIDYVNSINNIVQQTSECHLDPQIKWDLCKSKVKTFSVEYGKIKARENRAELYCVKQKLEKACNLLCKHPDNVDCMQKVNELQNRFNILSLGKTQGVIIRAKATFAENGEQSNKYFLALEKQRVKNKIMTSIQISDNVLLKDPELIMKEQVNFYQKLYENPRTYERRNLDDFVKDVNIPKLSVEDSSNCEGVIELNECTNALKQMKNSSSPGLDGLSAAFYKVFWCKIQKMVLDSLNRGYNNGQLSCSQREGLITLLPKKDLPRKFLKNWRPLTLTNVDYKMAASVMAIRIKKVITKIIHEDQCGYIKGRSSCTILRNIDDVITYLNDTDQQGIFLAIDYTKAFDSIYKDFMYDSLKLFGFGDSLIQWVKTLNENCTSSMNYNGWIHGNIKLERGIKQGCPLSPLLYIIASEILSCGIRQNRNINGVMLPQNKETKVLQYADDTSMFLKDCKSLIYTIKYFDIFTVVSGLKINKDKTEAMWLGKWKTRQTKVSNLKWKLFPNDKITLLGITFSNKNTC